MSLIDDPDVTANLQKLADQTGIPTARLVEWLEHPAPQGIDPADWYDAGLVEGRDGKPMPWSAIEELRRHIAAFRGSARADAA